MRIEIRNIAKIRNAVIDVDGITVIAGKNNTGKSTIGELLSAYYIGMNNRQEKNIDLRVQNIYKSVFGSYTTVKRRAFRRLNGIFRDYFEKEQSDVDELISFIRIKADDIFSEDELNEIKNVVSRVQGITDSEIVLTDLEDRFKDVLNDKVNSQFNNESGSISFIIKDEENTLVFQGNKVIRFVYPTIIRNTATYIRNPFDLDDEFSSSPLVDDLRNKIMPSFLEPSEASEPVSKLLAQGLLSAVLDSINQVSPGLISFESGMEYRENGDFSIDVASLSTGLKSFMILKQLILRGQIKEKDVLVLDEPEIHLHPEWQLIYAEVIVMLQKALNLSVLITTHSATFLEALDLFSRKHGIVDGCNYYLAKEMSGSKMVEFENVTKSLDLIYKELVTPTMLLTSLREKLTANYATE